MNMRKLIHTAQSMKTKLQVLMSKAAFPLAITLTALLGWRMATPPRATPPSQTALHSADAKAAPRVAVEEAALPAARADAPLPAAMPLSLASMSLEELRDAWNDAPTLDVLQSIAGELAARNSADSVQLLMDAIGSLDDWPSRAELSKNLRAVSDPATLPALLPALLNNYGRGNTILNEIADAVARMAQPDTVEALAVMHWQASTQAGQGHKLLRTVAGIRNPPAKRALARLAEHAESPALAAAAAEALKNFPLGEESGEEG